MDIDGFTFLGIMLNLIDNEKLVHILSVIFVLLSACTQNCPLCIGPRHLLSFLFY